MNNYRDETEIAEYRAFGEFLKELVEEYALFTCPEARTEVEIDTPLYCRHSVRCSIHCVGTCILNSTIVVRDDDIVFRGHLYKCSDPATISRLSDDLKAWLENAHHTGQLHRSS